MSGLKILNDGVLPLTDIREAYYSDTASLDKQQQLLSKIAQQGWFDVGSSTLKNLLELSSFFESAGRTLVPGKLFSSFLAQTLIEKYASDKQKKRLLPEIANGRLNPCTLIDTSLAWFQGASSLLSKDENGSISGKISFVQNIESPDLYICPVYDQGSVFLYLLEPETEGITMSLWEIIDPTFSLGEVHVSKVGPQHENLLGDKAIPFQELQIVLIKYTLLLTASMAGSVCRICDLTVDYANNRIIGEGPIARFQAISHPLVNIYMEVEKTRALIGYAASCPDKDLDAGVVVSMAKAAVDRIFLDSAQRGIQIHGATAFQWTHEMNFFFRRALLTQNLMGSQSSHYDYIGERLLNENEHPQSKEQDIIPLLSFPNL